MRPSPTLLVCALLFTTAAPAARAQDRFGAAVTMVSADEIVALKPGSARGPAVALVFRRSADGTWTSTARLPKLAGGFPGEGLTPGLATGGDFVLLSGGDPDGMEAGHLYRRTGDGWAPVARLLMDPEASTPSGGLPAGGLDMPTLDRLMAPPARTVALAPDGARIAVAGGSLEEGTVHVLRHEGGAWIREAVLRSEGSDVEVAGPGSGSGFGAALALGPDRLVVGAPGQGPGGAVHVFERAGEGWARSAVVTTDSTEADAALGAAVAVSAGRSEIFAGAPGRDRVVHLTPGTDGAWTRAEEIDLPAEHAGEAAFFGAAIALAGDRLMVGAPLSDRGRGRAYGFGRNDGAWTLRETLTPNGLEGRVHFGSAVGLQDDRAAVGAPDAFGGQGRVAVFDLDGRGEPRWLDPGDELRSVAGGDAVRCDNGAAAGFACHGVDLVSFLSLSALGAEPGERVTDIWGWTDPETGREYVLAGRTAGLAFVDITEPGIPRLVGLMPANPSGARDVKVYRDHAFLTGDGAGDHGLLVFDLTRLRGVAGAPATFEPDARYGLVASAHNLVIDTESGFAYTVGTNTGGQSCGGGLHMIDIRDPLTPTFAGCYTDTEGLIWSGRTHDAQCTVYRGPDVEYRGRQICFASNETAIRIVDVTDKSAPLPISAVSHPGTAYVHQGWLTEDQRYLYVNDELDEIVGTTDRTRTLIYDVVELDDPILVGEHFGPDRATDHNLFIRGDRAYLANYQAGMRVLDISDPEHPLEVGWFDTTPYGENPPGFGGGAWTAWPFFESGLVVVSSINEGLFILRPQRPLT